MSVWPVRLGLTLSAAERRHSFTGRPTKLYCVVTGTHCGEQLCGLQTIRTRSRDENCSYFGCDARYDVT